MDATVDRKRCKRYNSRSGTLSRYQAWTERDISRRGISRVRCDKMQRRTERGIRGISTDKRNKHRYLELDI